MFVGPPLAGAPWLTSLEQPRADSNPALIPIPADWSYRRPEIVFGPAFPGAPWAVGPGASGSMEPAPSPPVPPPPPPNYVGNDKPFIPYWPQTLPVVQQDGRSVVPIDARLRRSSQTLADIVNSLMRQGELIKTGTNSWTLNAPGTDTTGLTGTFTSGTFGGG